MSTVMNSPHTCAAQITRQALVHQLYEAAELEHNLMCTYLYAADGEGFTPEWSLRRGDDRAAERVTPMPVDYDTVGVFYKKLDENLKAFVARVGEKEAFCGDRNLQISRKEIDFQGCDPVFCALTATRALEAIVNQGEGAESETADSHYCRFLEIRDELRELKTANPDFQPAHPAAVNPVLRRPVRQGARVWLENDETAAASGQGAVHRSRAGPDARGVTAGRASRAVAGGPKQSRLQWRHVVHRAARVRAAAPGYQRREVLRGTRARTGRGRAPRGRER